LQIAKISCLGFFCFRHFPSSLLLRGSKYSEPTKCYRSITSKLCQTTRTAGVWSRIRCWRHENPSWRPIRGDTDHGQCGLSTPRALL